MNKKGFTLVELLVSITLIATIAYFLFQIIFIIRDIYIEKNIKSELYVESANVVNVINKDIISKERDGITILGARKVSGSVVDITFSNGMIMEISVDRETNKISYGTYSVEINKEATIGEVRLYYNYDTASLTKNGVFYVKIPIVYEKYNADFSAYVYSRYSSRNTIMGGEIFNVSHNRCVYEDGFSWSFSYTGGKQNFEVPCDGTYKLEVWGAQGGSTSNYAGGKGGYAAGNVSLTKETDLYVVVGGQGKNCQGNKVTCNGGYNGGGSAKTYEYDDAQAAGGGGATHIGTFDETLYEHGTTDGLYIVAAGGGGAHSTNVANRGAGGVGGGTTGGAPTSLGADIIKEGDNFATVRLAVPGTNDGPACTADNLNCSSFGHGGNPNRATNSSIGSGGGSGVYGGSGAYIGPGAGGASWLGGVINGSTISGDSSMPAYNGVETMTGNAGNGFAKITLVSSAGSNHATQYYEVGHTWDFDYTGDVQDFVAADAGTYKLEVWGAQGGSLSNLAGGKGGYSVGEVTLSQNEPLYIYVGQEGQTYTTGSAGDEKKYGAFPNGGAIRNFHSTSTTIPVNTGGGSTHIATEEKTIAELGVASPNLLIVAGGGGGVANYWSVSSAGGYGGGAAGGDTTSNFQDTNATGGSQTAAGLGGGNTGDHERSGAHLAGAFGMGGGVTTWSDNDPAGSVSGGGGGGYYGGGASWGGSGAGGSGYIGGVTNGTTIAGNASMPTHDGTSTMTGNSGNGHARITLLSVDLDNIYKESTLNGAYPNITGDLVPVIIEDDGTVKKADITSEWYSYQNKVWANAIIPKDKSITYRNGDIISESNIDSYFVWIPRYKYKIFNTGNYNGYTASERPSTSLAQTIEVTFESRDDAVSTGSEVGEWLTHPAFTAFDVNGIWVGKFETSGSTSDIDVIPNVKPLLNVSVGNFFTAMYNYERDLDSHMLKNTEWGAITYLAFSVYGINDDVRINNNKAYMTGCAATVAATSLYGTSQSDHTEGYYNGCENRYNTAIGYLASTTGNISGIYDMSGGAFDYVAAYISGKPGSSGLTPTDYAAKYFDVYNASSSSTTFKFRILGDATGEFGPFYNYKDSDNNTVRGHNSWYEDYSNFVGSDNPWFHRGGRGENGIIAGILDFSRNTGGANVNATARLALAP